MLKNSLCTLGSVINQLSSVFLLKIYNFVVCFSAFIWNGSLGRSEAGANFVFHVEKQLLSADFDNSPRPSLMFCPMPVKD